MQITDTKLRLFSEEWILKRDEDGGAWTNGDHYAAIELHKRLDPEGFTRTGFLCQLSAAYFHHKSAAQLKELGDKVGRERIQIIHGTQDKFVPIQHARVLIEELGGEGSGIATEIWEGKGHGLPMETRKEIREAVERLIDKTEAMK